MRAGMVIAASRLSAPPLTLGDIVLEAGRAFLYLTGLPFHKQRALYRIAACGTGVLGWYLRECDQCGAKRAAGRQCNDRNCPTCGAKKSIAWIKERESEILPCPYFHCVFTLPDELRTVAMENEKVLYNLLFTASRETLLTFAADKTYLGATPSMFQVLHTATRSLDYHPHCHVAISAGGYDAADDRWIPTKNPRFLFPIKAVSKVFRGKFLEALDHAYQDGDLELTYAQHGHLQERAQFQALLDQLYAENWHVYTKRAFGGPKSVIRYLGRYTHKTAVKNHQIRSIDDGLVTFSWTCRRSKKEKRRTLPIQQFLLQHVTRHILPKGFHRIRHAGLLARNQRHLLVKAQAAALRLKALPADQVPTDALRPAKPRACPCCPTGILQLKETRFHRVDYLRFPNPNGVALPWGYTKDPP
jgi:hypothetical protein